MFVAVWCLMGAIVMLIGRLFGAGWVYTFPLFFHGVVAKCFGLQCEFEGRPVDANPTFYVSNHISYMDVFVLGSVIKGSFVAKSEVAGWPVFGKLASLQNTLFLERNSRRARDQIKVVSAHLRDEGSVIVFPEGTSTDGTDVAPFRSSLFAAAEGVTVQPVTVAYVSYEGERMTPEVRENYAWYLPDPAVAVPNKPFAAHFFAGLGLGRAVVKVRFHEPFVLEPGERKEATTRAENDVRSGLFELNDRQSESAAA